MSIKNFKLLLKNSIIYNPNIKLILVANICLIITLNQSLQPFLNFFPLAKLFGIIEIILFNSWILYNKTIIKKWNFGKYNLLSLDLDREILKLNNSIKINFEDIKLIDIVEYNKKPFSPLAPEKFINTDLIIYLNDNTKYNVNIQYAKTLKRLVKILDKTIIPISYAGLDEENIVNNVIGKLVVIIVFIIYLLNWQKCFYFLVKILHGN